MNPALGPLARPWFVIRARLHQELQRRHGAVLLFIAAFCAINLALRLALLIKAHDVVAPDASLLAAAGWGLLFDLATGCLVAGPLILALTLLPARTFRWRPMRVLAHLAVLTALALLWFGVAAEWLFWDEFGVRFNFIAVDYLVYTHEVVANIRQSYPMPWIFAGIAGASVASWAALRRAITHWLDSPVEPWGRRWWAGLGWAAGCVAAGWAVNMEQLPTFANNYNRELAKNGLWSLFAAFRNNELDYNQFYQTTPVDDAFKRLGVELAFDGSRRLTTDPHDPLRLIRNPGPELHLNVIQITVESLSADFLGIFNHASQLTPNLEAIARKSLVFERLYATGTRTDRGMEALTLSLPPTPGRSLVKRPHNENLFTLGSVFRSRGYDTAFIYGGYGYFDNMNYFFGHNGYRVIDRAAVAAQDITFANAWGACDEDVFRWTLREADAAAAAGKPFHFFVMTTSNHRPYTYPEGRIDLPPKISGRSGAVKYTDYAIGQLLREAEGKPWFRNTVFVIVADHCASVAGKAELPVENYHIPLIVYAPGGQIPPGHVPDLMSQVDYAPTLLGLLNWTYASRFFGWDVRKAVGDRRALIGNYQKLGLYEEGVLSMVMPRRASAEFSYDRGTRRMVPRPPDFTNEVIAYYQTASYLFQNGLYREVSVNDQRRYAGLAPLQ